MSNRRIFAIVGLEIAGYALLAWKLPWAVAGGIFLLHWAINLTTGAHIAVACAEWEGRA